MKTLVINLIAITTLIAFKAAAIDTAGVGPMDVKLTVMTQEGSFFEPTTGKTNSTATSTNITTTGKSTITKTKFTGADLLALMANSFNTNFPAGSQVGFMAEGALCVVDSTGTNIIYIPPFPAVYLTGVFSPADGSGIESGTQVLTTTIDASGTTVSGYGTALTISVATLHYDDSGFTPVDGTPTIFTFSGEYDQTNTRAKGKDFVIVNGQLQGAGSGTLRGQLAVLTGTFRIKPFSAIAQQ